MHTTRVVLEYLHLALVIFFFGGFLIPSTWRTYYVHRLFVPIEWLIHRLNNDTCPLTQLTKHLHRLEDPNFVENPKGCVQQAFDSFGINLPEWPITVVTTFCMCVCVYNLRTAYLRRKAKRTETVSSEQSLEAPSPS